MRYLDLLTALFATVLLVSNVASTKLVVLGPFTFDGGTLLFPLAYIFGDVLTEVYGYRKSRRVIWIGFFALLLATLTCLEVLNLRGHQNRITGSKVTAMQSGGSQMVGFCQVVSVPSGRAQ